MSNVAESTGAQADSEHLMSSGEKAILLVSAGGFLLLAVLLTNGGEASPQDLFRLFALVPGLTGLANYIVTRRQRKATESEAQPEATLDADPAAKAREGQGANAEESYRPTLIDAMAASAVLTAIFLVPANASAKNLHPGLVYAGYGAYISTLWFMLVRLNANALSPRFLLNSALKASIAMLVGFVASSSVLFKTPQTVSALTLYFLIGLCHAWAIKALRKTAMATFGVTLVTAADLSVRLLEGVDEGAADVLEELGITSVQHLATMHAPEVCGRSLYPRDRVLDWIDQAILVLHVNGRIAELRAIGIRSAYSLVTIASESDPDCDASESVGTGRRVTTKKGDDKGVAEAALRMGLLATTLKEGANQRFGEAALRLGLSPGGLRLVAECIRRDPAYITLESVYPHRHQAPPNTVDKKVVASNGNSKNGGGIHSSAAQASRSSATQASVRPA